MNLSCVLFILLGMSSLDGSEIEKLSMPIISGLQRADIYILKLSPAPKGLLILCPGCNEDGRGLIENRSWQKFGRDHKLDLVGLSFTSDVQLLKDGRGYYYPRQGSGQLLLDGIRQSYHRVLPLLLYGFSGGAHFTSGFVQWRPEKVVGWCAYSAEWWPPTTLSEHPPPGLVACGEDDPRLGASLLYFKQGRAVGNPWLWLCIPHTGHSVYPPAEEFIRAYFKSILTENDQSDNGEWIDIDHKSRAEQNINNTQSSVTGWLPDSKLLLQWQKVNEP